MNVSENNGVFFVTFENGVTIKMTKAVAELMSKPGSVKRIVDKYPSLWSQLVSYSGKDIENAVISEGSEPHKYRRD